jgi:hypothetical protein
MSWDDNWTRALVTILAATVGAIIAGIVNAYAANRKIREIELQYLFKRRDSYIDNARSVMAEVYIPISIALTKLSNSYQRFMSMSGAPQQSAVQALRADFETESLVFLDEMDSLFARGADAYLTTAIDERLNDFNNFLRSSLDRKALVKKRVYQASISLFGLKASSDLDETAEVTTRVGRVRMPPISISTFGTKLGYAERVLSAPIDSEEFETRFKNDLVQIKFLVKDVTLGSTAPTVS